MSKYIEAKAKAKKVALAGIGGGCLIFFIGIFAKVPALSIFGLLASAGSGGTGYVMIQNAKNLRTDDEIYEEKRNETVRLLENAKQRANQIYKFDYFDIDRNKPDFLNFNAYEMSLSDGTTKSKSFDFIEKQKLYGTRTKREVDRVTKKKVYYKETQETYLDRVIIEIHHTNSIINARVTASQYNSFINEYNQLETRCNSVANLEREYEQILSQRKSTLPKSSPSNVQNRVISVNKSSTSYKRRNLEEISKGYRISNKYEVIDKLGEGGFGATFIVKSLTANIVTQFVAKCQKMTGDYQEDQKLIERFEQEANALQRLGNSHGQVPSLFDHFDYEGNFYIIQELVRGRTLMDIVNDLYEEGYLLSDRKASLIIASLLEVLENIHEQGIIHRDIKPQNIILREGDEKPVLIDFGLVKELDQNNLQQTGTAAGTIGYCPIEQQLGKALFQSDLYAVGMVMLFLTTARPPHTLDFSDKFEADLEWAEPIINANLLDWIATAIQPFPQARFASAKEMLQVLLDLLNQEYLIRGAQIADGLYQQQIASMEAEIQNLQGQLNQNNTNNTSGRSNKKVAGDPNQWLAKPKLEKQIPSSLDQIITTQKELDACNIVKRIIQSVGYEPQLLQLTDAVDYCDIHLRDRPDLILARLYFNDESNLAFGIPQVKGAENLYPINTLRGLSSKKSLIIERLEFLFAKTGSSVKQKKVSATSSAINDENEMDEILRREILPFIISAIEDRFGSDFEIITLRYDDKNTSFYGKFAGLNYQSGRKFDYEASQNSKGGWLLQYKLSQESLKEEETQKTQQLEEDKLARQGIYQPGWLQRNFDSFQAAKEHFGVTAKSWQKLADKLNEKNSKVP